VFSNRYYLRKLSIDGKYYSIVTQGLHNVVALDFDLAEEQLYFIDVQTQKILRINMNGTGMETVVWQNLPSPDGLAVDWIGR
jgi:Low-density lipoprotein receptor repeat class B